MNKNEEGIRSVVKLMIKTLNQMGVTLVNIDVDSSNVPIFFIEVDKSKILQSLEDTLNSAYGILWTLVNGKVTDENRDEKIDLRYNVVGENGVKLDEVDNP